VGSLSPAKMFSVVRAIVNFDGGSCGDDRVLDVRPISNELVQPLRVAAAWVVAPVIRPGEVGPDQQPIEGGLTSPGELAHETRIQCHLERLGR
jgi:hypothetical protein